MTATPKWSQNPADAPFFSEWDHRAPDERRSLDRALAFAAGIGLPLGELHPLVVVGSKGKGTAATYAAATLHQAGHRVGLITSPGYRTNCERIRLDGVAIPGGGFDRLSARVLNALQALPPREPGAGYLSPNGAFMIAGLTWLRENGCDALVVEAGKGGASDESSLTKPSVVAITSIFEEHVAVLGHTVAEIAAEKAGIISPSTRFVVSAVQRPPVRNVIDVAVRASGASSMSVPDERTRPNPGLDALPTSQMSTNAEVGIRAAHAYQVVALAETEAAAPAPVPEVFLPGRLSVHRRSLQTWVVDSAIDATGAAAAIAGCRRLVGEPTTVLLSIPTSRDLSACIKALRHPAVRAIRVEVPHLTFATVDGATLPTLADLDHPALGDVVLAVGTLSFVGEVLDLLDVDMSRLF